MGVVAGRAGSGFDRIVHVLRALGHFNQIRIDVLVALEAEFHLRFGFYKKFGR